MGNKVFLILLVLSFIMQILARLKTSKSNELKLFAILDKIYQDENEYRFDELEDYTGKPKVTVISFI